MRTDMCLKWYIYEYGNIYEENGIDIYKYTNVDGYIYIYICNTRHTELCLYIYIYIYMKRDNKQSDAYYENIKKYERVKQYGSYIYIYIQIG
jgi:hypothetical protein